MKYMRFLAILPMLLMLAGCGGGGSTGGSSISARQAVVTFHVQWPSASRSTHRAVPVNTNFILVEGFVGNTRIGMILLQRNGAKVNPTDHLSVPLTGITFYANAFETDPTVGGQNYVTDPVTGHLQNNGLFLDQNAINRPLAHAVDSIIVSANTNVNLTLDNAIATLLPIDRSGTNTDTVVSLPTTPAATINLDNFVQAKDANGATVVFDSAELTWAVDPTDPLAATRLTINPDHSAVLKSAGPVRLIVKDTNVNGPSAPANLNLNQQPIQGTVGFTIIPADGVTVALDTSATAPAGLAKQTPLYAKSVKLTLTETSVGGVDVNGAPYDTPVPPVTTSVDVTSYTRAPDLVTLAPVTITYRPTGRPFTITAEAWSEKGAHGILLAQTISATINSLADPSLTASNGNTVFTYSGAIFPAVDYKISGLSLKVSPSILYYLNPGQQQVGLATTSLATVTLKVAGNDTNSQIDPGAAGLTTNSAAVAVDNVTDKTVGRITAQPVGIRTTATVTVADSKGIVPGNAAAIDVYPASGSAGLNIK